jgi:hypothetical protein
MKNGKPVPQWQRRPDHRIRSYPGIIPARAFIIDNKRVENNE